MFTIKVNVGDAGMALDKPQPEIAKGNQERVRLDFEPEGTFAGAADACALSVRFADGSEVDAPYGKCFVPQDKFYATDLTFQAVAGPVAKPTNLLYSDTITTAKVENSEINEKQLSLSLSTDALVEGNTYVVVFDGVKYVCKAQAGSSGGNWVAVGNMYLRYEEEAGTGSINGTPYEAHDEPFAFQYWYGWRLTTAEAGEHTLELWEAEVGEGETVSNALTVELQPDEDGLYTFMEGGDTVLLDQTVSTTNGGGSSGMHSEALYSFKPVIGKEYKVIFDGVEYLETAQAFEAPDWEGCISIGYDEDIYCDPDTVPFVYLYMPEDGVAAVYSTEWADHHITIIEHGEPTPVKRLPASVIASDLESRMAVKLAGEVVLEGEVEYMDGMVGTQQAALNEFLEVGREYVLKVGDVERRGVAFAVDELAPGAVAIGNTALMTDGSGGDPDYLVVTVPEMPVGAIIVDLDRSDLEGATIIVSSTDVSIPVCEAVADLKSRVDATEGAGVAAAMFVMDMMTIKFKLVGITVEDMFAAFQMYRTPFVVVHNFHENNQYWDVVTNAIGYDENGNSAGVNGAGPTHYISFRYNESQYIDLRKDGAIRSWDNDEWQMP